MQLLSVLPAQSGNLLPPSYRELMTDDASPLAQFYPRDFEVDLNGKRNAWECVVKIPFLDEKQMIDVLSVIDHKRELTPVERARNTMGFEHEFRLVEDGESKVVETNQRVWTAARVTDP